MSTGKTRLVFIACILLLMVISIAAGYVLPFRAFVTYLVILLMLIGTLPRLLGMVLDPRNAAVIRKYFADRDISDVIIKPYPNHYGVYFRAHDRRLYARCIVAGDEITWKGRSPEQLVDGSLPK